MNRIVARFVDGRIVKGFTTDFLPGKATFHVSVQVDGAQAGGAKPEEVRVGDLKALFFVKSFEGDPQHKRSNEPAPGAAGGGRRIRVVFKDGETLVGTTQGYDRSRPGFFLVPFDITGNNERCFVVAAATQEVGFI